MQRVLIIGSPAAGKSTAARKIAQITGLKLIHLDYYYWLPDWERPQKQEWVNKVNKLISQSSWIIDGNYSSTLKERLKRADTVIFLDYPTYITMWRLLLRTLKGGREKEFPAGCQARMDWSFFPYVYRYRNDRRQKDIAILADFTGETYHFRSPAELSRFIKKLKTDHNLKAE